MRDGDEDACKNLSCPFFPWSPIDAGKGCASFAMTKDKVLHLSFVIDDEHLGLSEEAVEENEFLGYLRLLSNSPLSKRPKPDCLHSMSKTNTWSGDVA